MLTVHETDPLPFAGETVIHGDSVIATQLPEELTLISETPPAGPIFMVSASTPNGISGLGLTHAAIDKAERAANMIFLIFILYSSRIS